MKAIRLKPKAFTIDLQIYPYTIFVCFIDLNLLKECLENYKYKIPNEQIVDILSIMKNTRGAAGRALQIDNGNVILFFPTSYFTNSDSYMFNVITHEVLHAVEMILTRIGLVLDSKTDEAFCYLNGYINEQIFKEI